MIEMAIGQFLIFGVPALLLAIVYLLGWKWNELVFRLRLDVLVLSLAFSHSFSVIIGGFPNWPPVTTLGGLCFVFLGYGILTPVLERRFQLVLQLIFTNYGLFVLLQPLLADSSLAYVHWVLVNALILIGHKVFIKQESHFVSLALGILLMILGGGVVATGSMTLGQGIVLLSTPFVAAFFYKIVTKKALIWNRYTFFFLPMVSILALEHYHYSF